MALAQFGLRASGDVHHVDTVHGRPSIMAAVGRHLIGRYRHPARELTVVAQATIALTVARARTSDRRCRRAGRGKGDTAARIGDVGATREDDEASAPGSAGGHGKPAIETP